MIKNAWFFRYQARVCTALFPVFVMGMIARLTPAYAGIAGIGTAKVNKDVFTVTLRSSYTADEEQPGLHDRIRMRLMTDYGFTDDYAFGLYIQGDKRQDDDMELDALIMEHRIELTDASTHGYYSGFRLRYTYKDGDKKPDNAHIRLILGAPYEKWDFRINQIIAHDVGEGSVGGIGLDTRLQTTYGYYPRHRAGIESFSDFGKMTRQAGYDRQYHTIGPVFTGALADDLTYEIGYRMGVSEAAADHTFKVFFVKAL